MQVIGSWSFTIAPAFSVGAGLYQTLNNNSTPASLRLSAPVTVAQRPPQRWTARTG